ncbi:MAG TPA: PEP-CTERM sorting domain-containing protein [Lacipirellulaceae bacterium]|nr:PEP-CTERM sorting domain-containing protein [Lacipirellulaceae bacterium]
MCFAARNAQASTIAQAELSASGAPLTLDQGPVVSAVLSKPTTTGGRYIFLVDDGSGSMDVFGPTASGGALVGGYVPAAGDGLSISGPFSPFSGVPEMGTPTAITMNSSGNTVPAPLLETIPTLATYTAAPTAGNPYPSFAGHLVTIENVSISSAITGNYGTVNVQSTITDSGTHTLTGFYSPITYTTASDNLSGTPIARSSVNVTGLVQIFNGAPELLIMSVTPVPEPATCGLLGLGAVALLNTRRARKE